MNVIEALRRRVATQPAQPLFVHYDGAGSRVELSAVTFANWVDKTASFMESIDVEAGSLVHLDVATTDPGHWVTAVWTLATWQHGCSLTLDVDAADLVVRGPDSEAMGRVTVACSLHPLGLRFPAPPAGCIDYADVLAEPDAHWAEPLADKPWEPDGDWSTVESVAPVAARTLVVDPEPGWESLLDVAVAPALGTGTLVVVTNSSPDLVARVSEAERIS